LVAIPQSSPNVGWKFWAFVSRRRNTQSGDGNSLGGDSDLADNLKLRYDETASLISVNHPFKVERGSIGRVMPGQEVKAG